jgi:soluble P-type ATPase
MLILEIPGLSTLRLEHLVLDYNGTLAVDGRLIRGVKERLHRLERLLQIHVLTADTFGKARAGLREVNCTLEILQSSRRRSFRTGAEARAKATYVRRLGSKRVVGIGNGGNDRAMLRVAALAIAVIQAEGASLGALGEADLVVTSIGDALDLLLRPRRLVASLRC